MVGSSAISEKRLLTAIAVIIPVAYFLRLNSYQLLFEEPRRALVALEMLLADNWIVPTTNGALYYNKPPLYNWILIGFMNLLGKSEWVVRLPSILSLFATAILHYRISRNYIDNKSAIISALFYITSADILFYFSLLGEIDLFYALIVYLQGVLIFHFYQRKQWHWLFITSYLLTSAGVLTKGIPSLAFQAISLLVLFISAKDIKRLFSIWHFAGIGILAITAGGYFYIYSTYHDAGPYLARLFTETFSRSGVEKSTGDNLIHLVNFPVMLIKISAPWFLLFFFTLKSGWKDTLKTNKFLRYCLWFCLANGMIYALSPGTRERYLYMFFPFIYTILAVMVSRLKDGGIWIKRFYLFVGIALVAGILIIGVYGIQQSSFIPAILCLLIASIIVAGLLYFKPETNYITILATVTIILSARIAFDLVVLPTRKQNEPYKTDAKRMASIVGNEPVYFTGTPDKRVDEVKFAGNHFITYERNEPGFLAFQTSYYLASYTNNIIQYTTTDSLPGYYISLEESVKPAQVNIYYKFNNRINSEDHWFILYKNK